MATRILKQYFVEKKDAIRGGNFHDDENKASNSIPRKKSSEGKGAFGAVVVKGRKKHVNTESISMQI